MKMGADVAASPHFPESGPAPVRVWGFLGRFRPEPFGPGRFLGFQTKPCGSFGSLTGLPPKPCDFAGLPVWVLPKHRCFASALRVSRPKAWIRRTVEESGFGLRLALLPRSPVPSLGGVPSLRRSAASAVVVAMRTAPFPEGRSPAAKVPCDSAFRVAPSGILRPPSVEHVNPVDKFRATRAQLCGPGRVRILPRTNGGNPPASDGSHEPLALARKKPEISGNGGRRSPGAGRRGRCQQPFAERMSGNR
jgi:hypothetical protein